MVNTVENSGNMWEMLGDGGNCENGVNGGK